MYARLSICLIALILTGCNGVSKNNGVTSNPVATLDGNWEFVATSTTNPGVATVIDVQLQSNVGPAGSYSGSALSLQGQPTFSPYDCQGTFDLDQVDSLALTTTSDGVQVTGTFTDGSAVYNLTGTASGQTTSTQTITGTYTSSAGTPTSCQGSGMFVAHPGGWLTGNYLGTSGALSGSTLSVTQSGDSSLPGHGITATLSAGTFNGTSSGNTILLDTSGSDMYQMWWDTSTSTMWVWNSNSGVSGFAKQ